METWKHLRARARTANKTRFATYITPDAIEAARRLARERRLSDYQVWQEAIDEYLAKRQTPRQPSLDLLL